MKGLTIPYELHALLITALYIAKAEWAKDAKMMDAAGNSGLADTFSDYVQKTQALIENLED